MASDNVPVIVHIISNILAKMGRRVNRNLLDKRPEICYYVIVPDNDNGKSAQYSLVP